METAGESGPIERSHIKDMVTRNALEHAAYNKISKHLDNQRKAFVRQNTRDEEEMKHLLHRLQIEQQTKHSDDEYDSDDENFEFAEPKSPTLSGSGRLDPECTSNPYPVTIIPKFGALPHPKQPAKDKDKFTFGRPGSSRLVCRRKSVEYEDIQESLSSAKFAVLSSMSELSFVHDDGKVIGDWLAHPEAISSVRRMRKSVTDQSHWKVQRKLSNELGSSELPLSPGSPVSQSRNNSIKGRQRSNTISEAGLRPTGFRKRLSSMKEQRAVGDEKPPKQYSVQDLNFKKEPGRPRANSDLSEDGCKLKRKSSKKQTLQRKLSNDSTSSTPPSSRKSSFRRKQDTGKDGTSADSLPSKESGTKHE